MPIISIIMPAYNCDKYIEKAIQSILNQTFSDIEFIIINDGSTDNTCKILHDYAKKDDRIVLLEQENKGLVSSLNRGCKIAKGKYIARMDADDISVLSRLEKQVEYLESHPDVGVLGTFGLMIDDKGDVLAPMKWCHATKPGYILWRMLFRTSIIHASVMVRKSFFDRFKYNEGAFHYEDYDLWVRARKDTLFENLSTPLYKMRIRNNSICAEHSDIQAMGGKKLVRSMLEELTGNNILDEQVHDFRRLGYDSTPDDMDRLTKVRSLLLNAYHHFIKKSNLNRKERKVIAVDTSFKLYLIALAIRHYSFSKGLWTICFALNINPKIIFKLTAKVIKYLFVSHKHKE